jgi:hypothetical protein
MVQAMNKDELPLICHRRRQLSDAPTNLARPILGPSCHEITPKTAEIRGRNGALSAVPEPAPPKNALFSFENPPH